MTSRGGASMIQVRVNGRLVSVAQGTNVAAAVAVAGDSWLRSSVSGQPRGALCGMGICFECRVTIDREPHQRACQIVCAEGMEIHTT